MEGFGFGPVWPMLFEYKVEDNGKVMSPYLIPMVGIGHGVNIGMQQSG